MKKTTKKRVNSEKFRDPLTGKVPYEDAIKKRDLQRKSTILPDDRTGGMTGAPARPDLWKDGSEKINKRRFLDRIRKGQK